MECDKLSEISTVESLTSAEINIFQTHPHAVCVMDVQSAQILFANERAHELFGVSAGKLDSTDYSSSIDASDVPFLHHDIARLTSQQSGFSVRHTMPARPDQKSLDGNLYLKRDTVILRQDAQGKPLLAVCYVEDITASQIALEKAVRDEVYRVSCNIASLINHNLRNILNGAVTHLNVLSGLLPEYIPVVGPYIERCRMAILEATEYVRKMMHIHELESISPQPVNLSGLIRYFCDSSEVKDILQKEKIQFSSNLDSLSGIVISPVDEKYIKRIMRELFMNAVEAVEYVPDKKIDLSVQIVEDRTVVAVPHIKLTFRDNGNKLPAPMDIFQYGSSTKSTRRGYGLGLPLSRDMLKLMGGSIDICQTLGDNGSFCKEAVVTLPVLEILSEPVKDILAHTQVHVVAESQQMAIPFISRNTSFKKCTSTSFASRESVRNSEADVVVVLFPNEDLLRNLVSLQRPMVIVTDKNADQRGNTHVVSKVSYHPEQIRSLIESQAVNAHMQKKYSGQEMARVG